MGIRPLDARHDAIQAQRFRHVELTGDRVMRTCDLRYRHARDGEQHEPS